MEPEELLVLELVPAWFWSLGFVVVVVVVVWLPLGLFWVCDIVVLLLGLADWSGEEDVCAAATPKASSIVATVIVIVRIVRFLPRFTAFSEANSRSGLAVSWSDDLPHVKRWPKIASCPAALAQSDSMIC